MDKQQIIDYVMHNPDNTNPAVLSDLLDELEESSKSDFDTVQLTITNTSTDKFLKMENVIQIAQSIDKMQASEYLIGINNTQTLTLVTYKELQRPIYFRTAEQNPTLTGDITLLESTVITGGYKHRCMITGNATFSGEGIEPGLS